MCGDGDQACGGGVPGSVADALRMGDAFAHFLNSPAAAGLDGAACGEVLIALGGIQAKLAAAYAGFLRRFDAADAHNADGYGSSSAWLAAKAQLTKRDARAAVRQMRQFGQRKHLAEALATGGITGSWAAAIADWTRKLPADMRDETDRILIEAAAAGASLDDLATIAACAIEQWRQQQPDPDNPDDGFDDRYVQVGTTFGGAGVIRGNLTPECAAAVRAVVEALGKKPARKTTGPRASGSTTRCSWPASCCCAPSWSRTGRRRHPGHRPHPAVPAAPAARRRRPGGRLDPRLPRRGRLPDRQGRRGRRLRRADRPGRHRHHGPGRHRPDDRPGPDRGRGRPRPLRRRARWHRPATHGGTAAAALETLTPPATPAPQGKGAPGPGPVSRGVAGAAPRDGPPGHRPGLRPGRRRRHPAPGPARQPYNTPSLPLDIGYSDSIPWHIRRAVLLRDRKCAWPRCGRPAVYCDVHHLRHKEDGGETSLDNLVLACQLCRRRHNWPVLRPPGYADLWLRELGSAGGDRGWEVGIIRGCRGRR